MPPNVDLDIDIVQDFSSSNIRNPYSPSATILSSPPHIRPSPPSPIVKAASIGIIGAGPAGLSAAHALRKQGHHDVIILEANNHLAGKSATFDVASRGYEVGALMVGANYNKISALAKEFDCSLARFTGRA